MGSKSAEDKRVSQIIAVVPVFSLEDNVAPAVHFRVQSRPVHLIDPPSDQTEEENMGITDNGIAHIGRDWIEGLMGQIVNERGGVIFSTEQMQKIEVATLFVNGLLMLRDGEESNMYSPNCHPINVLAEVYGIVKTASGKRISDREIALQFGSETSPSLRETEDDPVAWAWGRFREANNQRQEDYYHKLCAALLLDEGTDRVAEVQKAMLTMFS